MQTSGPEGRLFDVLVVGAGPAGIAAAVSAADGQPEGSISVALLDAAARPGGQFWRHREGDAGRGHHAWGTFGRLRTQMRRHEASGALRYLPDHPVWHLEPAPDGTFTAHVARSGESLEVRGRTVVIATGAHDRSLPFPGWTLPGVITAGAAQALLKGQGVVAGRRVVVAGTGPFLLPVAAGLAGAGADVVAVLEAGRPTVALRHLGTLARNGRKLAEAAEYLASLARHGIPYRTRRAVIAAHGDDAVAAVTTVALDPEWRVVPGSEQRVECDTVAVGYGFTPQVELAVDIGCATARDADGSLVVLVDEAQQSSVGGAFVAGEACGVGGQALALVEGAIAGRHAAALAGGTAVPAGTVARLARRRSALREFANLMPVLWPVRPGWHSWSAPGTVACRCEEVSVGAVRSAVATQGATDARSAKLFSRAGMGSCQGRVCGFAVSSLVAAALDREATADDLGAFARRPVAWPVTLGALAAGDRPGRDTPPADATPSTSTGS